LKISVGPAPSHWGRKKIRKFYRELAESPADHVYVGETVCAERSCFSPTFLTGLCDTLRRAGKQVFASSLILVKESERFCAFRELAELVDGIEINSPTFLSLARHHFAIGGAFLHVHNSVTANSMAARKVNKIVLPHELGLDTISLIAGRCSVPVEVVVHGHIPIGISAACQTARSFRRNGEGCGNLCGRYPEGMVLQAGQKPLFRIEGPQTLSAATYCLVECLSQLAEAGVDTVRILPQLNHTARIVRIYRDVLDLKTDCHDALKELKAVCPSGLCNGWFLGKAGWVYESPHMPSRRVKSHARSVMPNRKPLDAKPQRCISETDRFALKNSCWVHSTDDIICEVARLAETMNRDSRFVKELAGFKRTRLVLSATDTGRGFLILLDKQRVTVRPYSDGPFDVRIRASEQILWDVLSGRMDADAAFFSGKAGVSGSLITAFRVKNKFLSLLQKQLACRLAAESESFCKSE